MLVKQGYKLYYYKQEKNALEIDFFVRNADSLIPIEVKASNAATASLTKLTSGKSNNKYQDVRFGIKLCMANVGFNGSIYTFPYFLTFLLKRYLRENLL